jgi:hypothetical protein
VPTETFALTITSGLPKLTAAKADELSESALLDPPTRQSPIKEDQGCPVSDVPRPDAVLDLLNVSVIIEANHCFQTPPTLINADVAVRHVPLTFTESPDAVFQEPLTLVDPGIRYT